MSDSDTSLEQRPAESSAAAEPGAQSAVPPPADPVLLNQGGAKKGRNVRCPGCGLVNLSGAEVCRRCAASPTAAQAISPARSLRARRSNVPLLAGAEKQIPRGSSALTIGGLLLLILTVFLLLVYFWDGPAVDEIMKVVKFLFSGQMLYLALAVLLGVAIIVGYRVLRHFRGVFDGREREEILVRQRLGPWLMLFAIQLCINAAWFAYSCQSSVRMRKSISPFSVYTGTGNFEILLNYELVIRIMMALLSVILLASLVKKSELTRGFVIKFMISVPLSYFVEIFLLGRATDIPQSVRSQVASQIVFPFVAFLVLALIWVPYFVYSEHVRGCFAPWTDDEYGLAQSLDAR